MYGYLATFAAGVLLRHFGPTLWAWAKRYRKAPLFLLAVGLPACLTAQTPAATTHEPAGFRTIASVPCNTIPEAGFKVQLTGGPFGIVKDPQRGSVCQTTYPAGFRDGRAPSTYFLTFPGATDLYVTYWSKLSAGWAGHPVGFKQMIAKTRSGWQMFPRIVGTRLAAGYTVETGSVNAALPATPVTWSRDAWHFNEILLTGAGRVTYWLDGVRVVDAAVPGWKPSPFTELQWRPIEGGNSGWKTPALQTEWLDELTVKVR